MSTPLYQLKAEFFKTIGHPARIRVLELLAERDHAVGEMLPEVGVEAANLSQHLAVLRGAGLIEVQREGRHVNYSVRGEGLVPLADWLGRYRAFWPGRIDKLKDLLREMDQ